ARLAQPGGLPRPARRRGSQPGGLLARADPLHRVRARAGLGRRPVVVPAQPGRAAVPAGGGRGGEHPGAVLCGRGAALLPRGGVRNAAGGGFGPVGIAAVITLALFFVAGGKPYYAGGMYTFLFAAGAVPTERWLTRRRLRQVLAAAALGLTTAVAATITLSVL